MDLKNLLKDAIRFFGLTENYNEAGYINPDGTLLDFSGRHLRVGVLNDPYKPNSRNLIHSNFLGINHQGYFLDKEYHLFGSCSNYPNVFFFMKHTGCVRCCKYNHFVSYIDTPTPQQFEILAKMYEHDDIVIEHNTETGETLDCEIIEGVTLDKIQQWVETH